MKQKGLAPILVALLIAVAIGGYLVYTNYSNNRVKPTPSPKPTTQPSSAPDLTANWKTYTNAKFGYYLKYPTDWSSFIPSTEQDTLDSICLGKNPNKCVLNITVLEGTSWDEEQKLLGFTLSSKEGTKEISFAGANALKRIGYFGETGSLYGFVTILQRNNKVYKIWVYQKTEDQLDYTDAIDQILSTFKFTD